MSTINSVNSMSQLAGSIVQNFDANRDGGLSAEEFTSFLTQLLGGAKTSQPEAASTQPQGLSVLFPTNAEVMAPLATPISSASSASYGAAADTVRPKVGKLMGFDDEKLNDTTHASFKYQIGRILQYYPSTKEGLLSALPEIQKLVPGAKIIGTNGDKLDFGDYNDVKSGKIGVVDVLVGAASGGKGWAWQPVEEV